MRNSGFTLIEMSIVLVILGLLVSAVLVGNTLILSAKIHSTAAQYNKLATGAKAFEAKYRWMPGDMPSSFAQTYNLSNGPCYQAGLSGPMVNPLNDGCEYDWWPTLGNRRLDRGTRELGNFYTHLSRAGMIDGSFGLSNWTGPGGDQSMVWVEPRLKRGIIYPDYCTNRNCFLMGATLSPPGSGVDPVIDMFTPFESYGIDVKLDDGNPFTGIVSAITFYTDIARDGLGTISLTADYTPSQLCCIFSNGAPDINCTNASFYDVKTEQLLCMIQLKW